MGVELGETEPGSGLPLLWAQRLHWATYRLAAPGLRWRANVRSGVPVPEGVSLDQVHAAIRQVLRDNDALRAVYRPGAGGGVEQFILPEFDPPVHTCDVADPAEAARWFAEVVHQRDFDLGSAPPIRFGVVHSGPVPRWLMVTAHHIVTDTFGMAALLRQVVAAFTPVHSGVSKSRRQPVAEVRYESSAEGVRANRAALEYWAGVLDEFPATTLPVTGTRSGEQHLAICEAATPASVAALARGCRTTEAVVILALYAAALGRFTGNDRTAVRVSSSNRFQPELLGYVGCLAQTLPVLLAPPVEATVAELVTYVKDRHRPLYRHSRYDFDEARTVQGRREFARGVGMDTMVSFNYADRGESSGAERTDLPAGSVVVEPAFLDIPDPFGLLVRRAGDRLTLSLQFDTGLVPEATARQFVLCLDRLLSAATADASVSALLDELALPAITKADRLIRRDGCQVSLERIQSLLATHPGVRSCHVEEDPADPRRIVAYVVGADPFECRIHLTARLAEWPAVVVPDSFVVVDSPGEDPESWRSQPVVTSGTGHDPPPFDQSSREGSALQAALRKLHDGAGWSGAATYLTAGGEAGRIDAVLALVEDSGFVGLDHASLLNAVPPGDLVRLMRSEHG